MTAPEPVQGVNLAEDVPPAVEIRSVASRRRRRREALLGYALVLPSLLVFMVFVFYPFVRNFYLGFYKTPPFPNQPKRYVGFEQYHDVLTSDYFRDSVLTTVKFVLLTVPAGIALGLALAVLAHRTLRGMGAYRTIFSSTVATSVAAASVIFFTLLNPQVGLFTYWLGREGELSVLQDPKNVSLPSPFDTLVWVLIVAAVVVGLVSRRWLLAVIGATSAVVVLVLTHSSVALLAVSVTTIWQNVGLSFILMTAGLQAIPDELYEAARVDGAGGWSRFRNVTIPMLSPTIFFAVVVGGIFAFQAFGQIDILTEGGPLDKTNVLVYAIYRQVFKNNNDGVAAVLAIALFAMVFLLTLFQLRFLERRVTYAR